MKQAYSGPIDQQRIDDVQEQSGHGVRAKIDEHVVLVGNDKLMSECGVGCHECELTGTILHVSLDGEYIGTSSSPTSSSPTRLRPLPRCGPQA